MMTWVQMNKLRRLKIVTSAYLCMFIHYEFGINLLIFLIRGKSVHEFVQYLYCVSF